jgi:methylmalonyl-CoA mutase
MFDEFAPATAAQWQQKITEELKNKPYDSLVWHTDSGFGLQPFYTHTTPQAQPHLRGSIGDNVWAIVAPIPTNTPKNTNTQALHALQSGATALLLHAQTLDTQRSFNLAFKDILPQYIHTFLHTNNVLHTIDLFAKFAKKNAIDPHQISGGFVFNPLNHIKDYNRPELAMEDASVALAAIKNSLPNFKLLYLSAPKTNGEMVVQTTAQALASLLHTANQYLDYLIETEGWTIDEITPHIAFEVVLNDDFYAQIAKIRALRLLWANVVAVYKPTQPSSHLAYIVATTDVLPNQNNDANIVRNTAQSMAAAMAGIDALYVQAHATHAAAQRTARNIQLVMQHESYMHEVIDVAAGSYFIEKFTEELAQSAWQIFIENKG